ncbi:MAG TPA: hypothetical protein VIY71_01660 [Solirubrobacterales bacterium]
MDRQPATVPPKLVLTGILIAAIVFLAGCGSASQSSSSSDSEANGRSTVAANSSKDPCEPRRVSAELESPTTSLGEGETAPIEIGKTDATLDLLRTASPTSISVTYGDKRKFQAPPGSMLVAVTYRLQNRGPGELKPSEDMNSRTFLRVAGNLYPYAADLPCNVPITASWAVAQGGSNPAIPIPVGDSVTTAVVFIVPKPQEEARISLLIPGQVDFELRGAGI